MASSCLQSCPSLGTVPLEFLSEKNSRLSDEFTTCSSQQPQKPLILLFIMYLKTYNCDPSPVPLRYVCISYNPGISFSINWKPYSFEMLSSGRIGPLSPVSVGGRSLNFDKHPLANPDGLLHWPTFLLFMIFLLVCLCSSPHFIPLILPLKTPSHLYADQTGTCISFLNWKGTEWNLPLPPLTNLGVCSSLTEIQRLSLLKGC